MIESPPTDPAVPPELHVEITQVCVLDGAWQDSPDHIAAFTEGRLLAAADAGEPEPALRGSLYIVLDVSGEVEGRSDVERELVETVRREYSRHRGSITFSLSEALRAANASLFEMNLQAPREARRMAGITAAVLRGTDLFITQAGPAVLYLEVGSELHRYPADSDWFSEDQPALAPQGNASPPLGVRKEFTCDLFHATIAPGDVFVLANRGLTQLATTEELQQSFAHRGAEDIGAFLEDIANGLDLSALVVELMEASAAPAVSATEQVESDLLAPQAATEPSSQPAVPVASQPAEPPPLPEIEEGEEAEVEEEEAEEEYEIPWGEPAPVPAAATLAAPAEPPPPPVKTTPLPKPAPSPEELARLAEERRLRRQALWERVSEVFGGIGGALVALLVLLARAITAPFRAIKWKKVQASLNRGINTVLIAGWNTLSLLLRLMLPGTPKQKALIPKRASKEPIWLKAVAVFLPLLFIGLALAACDQLSRSREGQAQALVTRATASLSLAAGKKDTDKTGAKADLQAAQNLLDQANGIYHTSSAEEVAFQIDNLANELDGITVLRNMESVTRLSDAANLVQIIADETDLYFFDKENQRVYHRVNGASPGSAGDREILKKGSRSEDNASVDQIRDLVWVDGRDNGRGGPVAITGSAFWQYDSIADKWRAYPVTDSAQWTDIRAVASFGGNIYLLEASKNQLIKYERTDTGFAAKGTSYLPPTTRVDFSGAVDMTVDSGIWVLNKNGVVLHFVANHQVDFHLSPAQPLVRDARSIYTRQNMDKLYVVDAANKRVVEYDKTTGRFLRQFKPEARYANAFDAIKALFYSASKRKFYLINGNEIFTADEP